MTRLLVGVFKPDDVLPVYRGTPVEDLLAYQNLGAAHRKCSQAQMLIGMCMDYRKQLRIPLNFAFVLRTGGANLRPLEFQVSYAVAVGGVRTIGLIGHNDCAMACAASKRDEFVRGLVENGGWAKPRAEEHYDEHISRFAIDDPINFVCSEAGRLRETYPEVLVAPLHYVTGENRLYQISEDTPPDGQGPSCEGSCKPCASSRCE